MGICSRRTLQESRNTVVENHCSRPVVANKWHAQAFFGMNKVNLYNFRNSIYLYKNINYSLIMSINNSIKINKLLKQ